MSKQTFFLTDGTTLTGEVCRSYTNSVDIVDEDGRSWTLFWQYVVKICYSEHKGGTSDEQHTERKPFASS